MAEQGATIEYPRRYVYVSALWKTGNFARFAGDYYDICILIGDNQHCPHVGSLGEYCCKCGLFKTPEGGTLWPRS